MNEKYIIELDFKPHDGLLTHVKFYWKDATKLIKAIQRAAYMEPEEERKACEDSMNKFLEEIDKKG